MAPPNPCAASDLLESSLGLATRDNIRDIFSTPVHPCPPSSSTFFLVVSFGRTSFRLDLHNVSLALEACLGVDRDLISVELLWDSTFRFSVFSKAVGVFHLQIEIL